MTPFDRRDALMKGNLSQKVTFDNPDSGFPNYGYLMDPIFLSNLNVSTTKTHVKGV